MIDRCWPLILLLVLTGCALHQPVAVTMPAAPPDRFLELQEQSPEGTVVGQWWSTFEDQHLNDMMAELFRQNLDLEQGFARFQQARATAKRIRAARFPALDVNGEASRSMQPTLGGDFTGNQWRLAAAASFEVDLWGKVAARSKSAQKLAEASYEDLRTLFVSLSAQLADLYYLAVEQRAQLLLTDETIKSFSDTVQRVESRYRMGVVPAVDVYQARQNLSAAQASRHLFEGNLANAEHALAVLLGRYPDRQTAGKVAVLPPIDEAFPVGLPSELVENRPDLLAALRRIEAADEALAAAIADRFPSVNLIANYGESSQELTSGLLKGDFWSLLGNLTTPLFDAGRRQAEVERNRAAVKEAVAAYQQAVLEAFREVEDALAGSYATELRIGRLEETARSTDASLRLSLQNYLYGLTDYLPVLTAQRNHFEVQSRLLSARRQLISDRISLARSLGGQWMTALIERRLASSTGADGK